MRSLGARLTWGYALVVMITVLATLAAGYVLLRRELLHGIDLLNFAEFREIRSRVEAGPRPVPPEEFLRRVAEHAELDAPLYFFQVDRPGGEVVFRSPNMGGFALEPGQAGQANWTSSSSGLGLIRVGRYPQGEFVVEIATSLRDIRQFAAYYLQVSALLAGSALVLSVFFGHRLSRLALDPIRRIQQTARRINADNLSTRIPMGRGNDEIAGLARLLNQMFDRLESSFERLWRFAGDASHELKTPLSLIRLQSEKLLLHGGLDAGQQEVIQQQLEGINRLNSVIERLLFLAKAKVGGIRPNSRPLDTAEFIGHFREDALVLCEDQGVRFEVGRNEGGQACFDATLLRQVLLNLLTNAVRASPAGGSVTLLSWHEDAQWKVSMEDIGAGLPLAELERIFEPFTRVDAPGTARHEDSAGTGLGLAICRGVLEAHGGGIRAANRRLEPGLRVSFELPTASPAEPADLDQPTPRWSRPNAAAGTPVGPPRG